MAETNTTMTRIPKQVKSKLFNISKELSQIEGRNISMGEVIMRILKAPDIRQRLKQGAMERSRK